MVHDPAFQEPCHIKMPESPLEKPVFILAAPRSGSTLLFETLIQAPSLWSIGDESHGVFESIPELRPGTGVKSNRLTAKDASLGVVRTLHNNFLALLKDRNGTLYAPQAQKVGPVRMIEKTPKNALRIPFLNAAFPNCQFIYLYREPKNNISSIMEAWRSGRFITYPDLLGKNQHWSLLLPPDWMKMRGKPLESIAGYQWKAANQFILEDLARLAPERWTAVTYHELISAPQTATNRLCNFMQTPVDEHLKNVIDNELPLSKYTLSQPGEDKWLKNAEALNRVLPGIKGFRRRVERIISSKRHQTN